jgi:uncharacterized membrane protein HdeD (DUF308 family)
MSNDPGHKNNSQLIWGIALALVGLAVFVRIPQVMPELEKFQYFSGVTGFIRVCFYLMGIILLGGGIKKIVNYFQSASHEKKESNQ